MPDLNRTHLSDYVGFSLFPKNRLVMVITSKNAVLKT